MKPYVSNEDALIENLRNDPAFAADYLNEVLTDGDQEELMIALRRVAQASGGMQAVAEAARLNPTSLYKTLSPLGNPELKSFLKILGAMGMKIRIMPQSACESSRHA